EQDPISASFPYTTLFRSQNPAGLAGSGFAPSGGTGGQPNCDASTVAGSPPTGSGTTAMSTALSGSALLLAAGPASEEWKSWSGRSEERRVGKEGRLGRRG